MEIERIEATRAREHVTRRDALLVCAYENPERCRNNHLDGALSLQDLQTLEDELPRSREIIFYCG